MKGAASGSIIVMIMLVMAILTILATDIVRSTGFMMDIAHKRVVQEQQYRAAEGLLNYGIATSMKNYRTLLAAKQSGKKKVESVIEQIPTATSCAYKGSLTFILESAGIQIKGILLLDKTPIYDMSCKLRYVQGEEAGTKTYSIEQWNICKSASLVD